MIGIKEVDGKGFFLGRPLFLTPPEETDPAIRSRHELSTSSAPNSKSLERNASRGSLFGRVDPMNKIVHLKETYKFCFYHFLIKCTVFVLNVKNVIKNQKLNFSDKLCDIQKNVKEQNCSLQKDLQILFGPFFDTNNSFPCKHEKFY